MGNIIAIGGGFAGQEAFALAADLMRLTWKERPNYLYLPTTAYDVTLREEVETFAKSGCRVEFLYLTHPYITEEIVADRIRRADLIHVPGGNLRFCLETWRETHADRYLLEAFEDGKTLFGSSSGAMCWFRKGYDDCGPNHSCMFTDGLGILPYCNVPHYERQFWQEYNSHAPEAGMSTIACENETAICLIDGKWSVRVSANRPDARAWFFDAEDGYRRYDLLAHPEILERL